MATSRKTVGTNKRSSPDKSSSDLVSVFEIIDSKNTVIFVCETLAVAKKMLPTLKENKIGLRIRHRLLEPSRVESFKDCIVPKGSAYTDWLEPGQTPEINVALERYNKVLGKQMKKTTWDYEESFEQLRRSLLLNNKKVEVRREVTVTCESLNGISFEGLSDKGRELLVLMAGLSSAVSRYVKNGTMANLLEPYNVISYDKFDPQMQIEPFTRHFLVDPLLTFLGYKTILPERIIDDKKVDYSIYTPHRPDILIEAEPIGKKLENDPRSGIEQVKGYMSAAEKRSIGIATDGIRWVLIAEKNGQSAEKTLDLSVIFIPLTKYITSKKRHLDIDDLNILDEFWDTFSSEKIFKAHSELEKTLEKRPGK